MSVGFGTANQPGNRVQKLFWYYCGCGFFFCNKIARALVYPATLLHKAGLNITQILEQGV